MADNAKLKEATQGRIRFRTYWGGTMGDDKTIIRKIRAGQIDGAPLGTQIVSQFVRQAMVFMAPQTFFNYKQVDAVRAALKSEFDAEAYSNGFKLLNWWDAGKVRIFSKKPVQTFDDLRSGRPWLYPESPLLKAFYKMINVTGVPLGLREVYGGLQTNMIDTVWISSVLAMAFRWHSKTKYVSATPVNIIQGALVMSRKTWEGINEADQQFIMKYGNENQAKFQRRFRKDDTKIYKRFLKRGFTAVEFKNEPEWQAAGQKLRDKMIGRIYDAALLKRVEKITAKYADQPTDMLSASR